MSGKELDQVKRLIIYALGKQGGKANLAEMLKVTGWCTGKVINNLNELIDGDFVKLDAEEPFTYVITEKGRNALEEFKKAAMRAE